MNFDIDKIEKLALVKSKSKKIDINLTPEEIEFMSNIFNAIINSDNYSVAMKYLAGINELSVSDIKFIKNIYYYYFADNDEKRIYNDKIRELKKENRTRGFIDFSVVMAFTIFIVFVGISLAVLLYNLL